MSRIAEPSSPESQGTQPQGPSRSKLVQRLLDASDDLPTFINDLLTTQAVLVAGTEAAAFMLQQEGEQVGLQPVAHIRPDESDAETRAAAIRAFQGIVARCVQETKDGAIEVGALDGGDSQYCLVTLLRNEGEIIAVSAVITRCRDQERAKQRLSTMQIVAGYFELYAMKRYVEHARMLADRHQNVLQYAAAVGQAEGFESAAMNLCNELATRTGASRVSLGWMKGKNIKVRALSHTEKFDKKQDLIVQVQRAMEECLDQEEPVRYDADGQSSQNVTRSAQELSRTQGGNIVVSVPLRRREEICGVLTLEFPPRYNLDDQAEAGIAVAAELLAPQLFDRHDNDRYIWTKAALSLGHLVKLTVGPKHWTAKLVILGVLALIGVLVFYKPMYHVRAGVVLAALEKRALCAPFEGTIAEVNFRPGEVVKQGDVIARLKTTELEVKLADALARVDTKAKEAERQRAERKIAEQRIAEAERDQAAAEARLYQYYIDIASIRSPVDGILLRGDFKDRVGAPVKQGDPMFEVARSDEKDANRMAVEAKVMVSERDIQEVVQAWKRRLNEANGDPAKRAIDGDLATTSFPDIGHEFLITRVVPTGEPKDGENLFEVYGQIKDPAPWMHPGLAGEARIDTEPRRVIWIWTHRLTDWLKLKLWI